LSLNLNKGKAGENVLLTCSHDWLCWCVIMHLSIKLSQNLQDLPWPHSCLGCMLW